MKNDELWVKVKEQNEILYFFCGDDVIVCVFLVYVWVCGLCMGVFECVRKKDIGYEVASSFKC